MAERRVIITGSNAGLGFACATELARTGWQVVLACRDLDRARSAGERIASRTGSKTIQAELLDLASLRSVRDFAARMQDPIDALVCNAGLQLNGVPTFTEDGFETTFAVNHLGHFLLANLLAPRMRRPARIVFVSSNTHDPKKPTGMPAPRFTDPQAVARGEMASDDSVSTAGKRRYSTSKLCNVYCAFEMSRRFPEIAVNAFDPGMMPGTAIARDYSVVEKIAWNYVMPVLTLFAPNTNTVGTSGRRLARLVEDPELGSLTGKYVSRGRVTESSVDSHNLENARRLWEASLEMTHQNRA
jgi:NAD(P)-dependent dehydrogenase (short-subunit alcohol dehydrogenase family)